MGGTDTTRKLGVALAAALALSGASEAKPHFPDSYALLRSRAAEKSADLQIARAVESQAFAAQFTAWSRWIPHLDLQLTQSRSKDYSIITSGALGGFAFNFTPQEVELRRWELVARFPLFQRTVQLGVEQASRDHRLARYKLEQAAGDLDWRLRKSLGNYLLQSYREATVRTSLELANTNLREAKLRFELGQRTKVDVLRAEANVVSLESRQLQYRQERQAALNDFTQVSGLSANDLATSGVDDFLKDETSLLDAIGDFTQLDSTFERIGPYLRSREATEKKLVDSSPNYQRLIAQESLDSSKAKSLMSEEWPQVNLQGNVNKQAQAWNDAFSPGQRSYSMAVVVTVPLFSGGSTFSTYYEKRNAQDAAQFRADKDMMSFRNEVENQRVQIESLMKTVEAQRLSLAQNEEIVRLSFKTYQLGKGTMVELLSSQNDLIEAKQALAKSKIDLSSVVRQFAANLGVASE